MFITSTGNSFTTSTFDTTSTVIVSNARKRRSKSPEFTEYTVHKPNTYKSFLKANSIKHLSDYWPHGIKREFYFGYLWITGIYFDFVSKEAVIIKPRKQLCRLADRNKYLPAKIEYVDDFDSTPDKHVIQIEDFSFNSKKIKKCFTEQDAKKHYHFLKEEYIKKVNEEKQKLDDFVDKILK